MGNTGRKDTPLSYTPAREIIEILQAAYEPCPAFKGACNGIATWNPGAGHVPRGFIGALGATDEVKVVILVAEPGDPHLAESYEGQDRLGQTCRNTFRVLNEGTDLYHRNLRYLLDSLFPGLKLRDQLRQVWITETYLCSAPEEAGRVPSSAENECVSRYLARQLEVFRGLPVIALGTKAYARANRIPGVRNVRKAYSVAPPGCNRRTARPSWDDAATWARAMFG